MTTLHGRIDSVLGELTLVTDGQALTGLYFAHHWYRPATDTFGPEVDPDSDDLLAQAKTQLTEYLSGRRTHFELPIAMRGGDMQRRVWHRLTAIACGRTVTYGELAAELADGRSAQEIGQAVGRNPLSVIVPCHRVVGKNGNLTGYAGGLERKQFLLDLEEPAESRAARLF